MGEGKPLNTEKAIISNFESLREEQDELAQSLNARSADLQEHEVVVKALKPLDPSRKCFRQIGDVLVERTIAEVLPAVQSNRDKLAELTEALRAKLEAKRKELADFQAQYKIRIRGEDNGDEAASKPSAPPTAASQGVLVPQS